MYNLKDSLTKEQLLVHGEKLYHKVNHMAREAHARHVTIKDRKHRHLVTFPMTLGIAGAVILPIIASIGLAAFLMNDWRIFIQKRDQEEE